MSKQDRQGARTVTDFERRYNFRKSFSEVMGVAEEAGRKADEAAELDEKLTSNEIFNRLTNNGTWQGLYRDEETGQVYVNASYIKSGKIRSDVIDGSSLNITEGATIAGWSLDDNSICKPAGGDWGKGTFMCTGSDHGYRIGGSPKRNGWVFGAGGKFGVASDGAVWCSDLHATEGSIIGDWYIDQFGALTSPDTKTGEAAETVYITRTMIQYIYDQGSGNGIHANWEDVIKAASGWSDMQYRIEQLEAKINA